MRATSWMRGLCALMGVFGYLVLPHVSQAAAEFWNLATDFRVFPHQRNPNPDSIGNPDVWHFMESSSLVHDPGTYALLPEFISDRESIQGLEGWQSAIDCTVDDKLPFVGINATGTLQRYLTITLPAGVVVAHPCFDQLAIVGWRSPIDGTVTIRSKFTDVDDVCGNGIAWSIEHGSRSITQGEITNGGSQALDLKSIDVTQGSFLYFIIDPKDGDHSCDSTGLDLTITTRELANSLVSFQPLRTTFRTTPDTAGCPVDSVAKFFFEARWTNTSTQSLSSGLVQVAEITSDDQLLRLLTETGLITRGGAFPVPGIGAYADGVLSPQEAVDVQFVVCLKTLQSFQLFVDVLAQVVR